MHQPPQSIMGDFTPIRVVVRGDETHVICVGYADHGETRVTVNGHACAVHDGLWTSPPIPYSPGMTVAVALSDGGGHHREISADLPGPDALGPILGPGWTGYAPEE
jgi:hypothetical protein